MLTHLIYVLLELNGMVTDGTFLLVSTQHQLRVSEN